MSKNNDFGLIGLGVMGRNFILNVLDNGFSASGLDTDLEKVEALIDEGKGKDVFGTTDSMEFLESLSSPRKIMLLVPAGKAVDVIIDQLFPALEKGDLIIDGGNSYFEDTNRREKYLQEKDIFFIGAGVSGGAKGARFGPSIMPGGEPHAYELIKPVFQSVAARVGDDPCVDYMGKSSAGNYVKMVHNGIEYGLMQQIAEVYQIMKDGFKLSNRALAYTFDEWNQTELQSFLVEITTEIFRKKDDIEQGDLIDKILDKAKQKGTGKWTSQNAMDLGMPIPAIDAAVTMRAISSFKEERQEVARRFKLQVRSGPDDGVSIDDVKKTLLFCFIITYSQGISQLKAASMEYKYELNIESIAKIWRGGCIIRASLLEDIRKAFRNNPDLNTLIMADQFEEVLKDTAKSARKTIAAAMLKEIPVMTLSACLGYFDAYKSARLPLNLVQAQRDHFGSHTYERVDQEGVFHTEW